jgi:hypothetical protein
MWQNKNIQKQLLDLDKIWKEQNVQLENIVQLYNKIVNRTNHEISINWHDFLKYFFTNYWYAWEVIFCKVTNYLVFPNFIKL